MRRLTSFDRYWRAVTKRSFSKRLVGIMLAGLAFVVWALFSPFLATALKVEFDLPDSEVIVVLAGSSEYKRRTSVAAEAFRVRTSLKIWLTDDGKKAGWSKTSQSNPSFVSLAKDELIRNGVTPDAIEILPATVDGTRDEAELVISQAIARGIRSINIVTTEHHSRRALWIFNRTAESKGSPVKIGVRTARASFDDRIWWASERGWRGIALEYLKFGYYWLFYSS